MLWHFLILTVSPVILGSIDPGVNIPSSEDWSNADDEFFERLDDYEADIELEKRTVALNAVEEINEMVTGNGYPLEVHTAQTEDGYLLTVHRIPYSPSSGIAPNKPVVFLQHGLLSSSFCWILSGPGKGLAYIMADLGYDVWMGNARGNHFSRSHTTLDPDRKKFWNFSWHELGIYDLPATIDYVLGVTGRSSLNYVGHSQGTTSFFVMSSLRPEYNSKISAMHALAPVAFMSNAPSPVLRLLGPIISKIDWLHKLLGSYEFMPSSKLMTLLASALCKDGSIFQVLCSNVLFLVAGYNHDNLNDTMLPEILKVTPAGASVNQFIHYAQSYDSGQFRQFDYGPAKNLAKYNNLSPPSYPLSNIACPMHFYYSNNDWLAAVEDVQMLAGELQTLVFNKMVLDETFNHLDFLWGINSYEMVYVDLIENIRTHT